MSDWQPIATAPRDGRYFLTANFSNPIDRLGEYEIAKFDPHYQTRYEEAGGGLFREVKQVSFEFDSSNFHRATHWADIPKPLALNGEDGKEESLTMTIAKPEQVFFVNDDGLPTMTVVFESADQRESAFNAIRAAMEQQP